MTSIEDPRERDRDVSSQSGDRVGNMPFWPIGGTAGAVSSGKGRFLEVRNGNHGTSR